MAVGAQAEAWGKKQETETVTGVLVPRDKGGPKATTSELEVSDRCSVAQRIPACCSPDSWPLELGKNRILLLKLLHVAHSPGSPRKLTQVLV